MIRAIKMSRVLAGSALVLLLGTAPVVAGVYTIHMTNGTTFQTRYEPIDAPWNDAKIVFTDEWGLLMSLPKAEIEKIESEISASGFGHQLDDTTIAFGWAPNDAPEEGTVEATERDSQSLGGEEVGAEEIDEPIYEPGETPGVNVYPGLDDTSPEIAPVEPPA